MDLATHAHTADRHPHAGRLTLSRRGAARLRVLVAHGSPLVAAGIASTLRRLPSCIVRVHGQGNTDDGEAPWREVADLIFGDAETAAAVRACALAQCRSTPDHGPKVVLVTIGNAGAAGVPAAERADACLSIDCAERDLVDTVNRLAACRIDAPRGGLAAGALRRVREHVDAHLAQRIDVLDMAVIAGLSPCHFGRAFKQSVGVSPHRFVMERRIEAAARLIRDSGRKLAEIALDVGFSDQSHFTRLFASHHGMTPLEFRRSNR